MVTADEKTEVIEAVGIKANRFGDRPLEDHGFADFEHSPGYSCTAAGEPRFKIQVTARLRAVASAFAWKAAPRERRPILPRASPAQAALGLFVLDCIGVLVIKRFVHQERILPRRRSRRQITHEPRFIERRDFAESQRGWRVFPRFAGRNTLRLRFVTRSLGQSLHGAFEDV